MWFSLTVFLKVLLLTEINKKSVIKKLKLSKREQILAAAIKRFSHFGIKKTTMAEIGEDVGLSKANLYYYFSDKSVLVSSIIDFLFDESERIFAEQCPIGANTVEKLQLLANLRFEMYDQYQMLVVSLTEYHGINAIDGSVFDRVVARESNVISGVLDAGIKSGELVTFDVEEASELYVSCIHGVSMFYEARCARPFMDKEIMKDICHKQELLAARFVNGILRK